jgi:hypothetical protein
VLNRYDVSTTYGGLPQKAYDSIGADIHATCGQLLLAKHVRESLTTHTSAVLVTMLCWLSLTHSSTPPTNQQAGTGFKSPVFHYSFGQDPSHPFCLFEGWCAKYALHALEMVRVPDHELIKPSFTESHPDSHPRGVALRCRHQFMLFDDYSVYMPTNYTPNAADNEMGDIMRHFWLYFAKHGDTPTSTSSSQRVRACVDVSAGLASDRIFIVFVFVFVFKTMDSPSGGPSTGTTFAGPRTTTRTASPSSPRYASYVAMRR